MSNQFLKNIKMDDQKDQPKKIVSINLSNFSEHVIPNTQVVPLRQIQSDNQVEAHVNYDDLCGPWIYQKNPVYSRYYDPPSPSLCVWKYFTQEDIFHLKTHQMNRHIIRSIFDQKFSKRLTEEHTLDILITLLWECFHFTRVHLFTEKSVSACLGIIYLTHSFFLSHPRRTAEEVFQFFHKTVMLHVIMQPPMSLEIFSVDECMLMFVLFHKMYIENLVLLHILCHTNFHFTLQLDNLTITS